ncbi:MAG: NBR1-Ig-like domain-containing protein [Anaerolineae bacterium]
MAKRHCPRVGSIIWSLLLLVWIVACTPAQTPGVSESLAIVTPCLLTPVQIGATLEPTPSPTVMSATTEPIPSPSPLSTVEIPSFGLEVTEPTASPAPPCQDLGQLTATFVADVNLPDGSRVPPGSNLRKIWRVRNTGDCAWLEDTSLVFVAGTVLDGPQRIPVTPAAPDSEVDIVADFTAPSKPGTYESYWRLQASGGHLFGAVIFMRFVVDPNAAAIQPIAPPTPYPTPTVMPLPSPTARPTTAPTPLPSATKPPATAPPTPIPPSPTSPPTVAPTATPMPTATPTAVSTAPSALGGTCAEPDPRFEPVVSQALSVGIEPPCVTGPLVEEEGTLQLFWQDITQSEPPLRLQSLVLLRDATSRVYVLDGKDPNTYVADVRAYDDNWTPTMPSRPEACAALVPPSGYIFPVQGIGKVWCENSLWNSIGWPEQPAEHVRALIQETQNGLLADLSDRGGTHYQIAVDLDTRAAAVARTP